MRWNQIIIFVLCQVLRNIPRNRITQIVSLLLPFFSSTRSSYKYPTPYSLPHQRKQQKHNKYTPEVCLQVSPSKITLSFEAFFPRFSLSLELTQGLSLSPVSPSLHRSNTTARLPLASLPASQACPLPQVSLSSSLPIGSYFPLSSSFSTSSNVRPNPHMETQS